MPFRRAAIPRRDVRQRDAKRWRSITRRRVRNTTSLISSTKRQEGRATVELADLSPIPSGRHRCNSPVSGKPVTPGLGSMWRNPKVQPALLPSAVCARSSCMFLEHVRSSACSRQDHPVTTIAANELLSFHLTILPVRDQPPAFSPLTPDGLHSWKPSPNQTKHCVHCQGLAACFKLSRRLFRAKNELLQTARWLRLTRAEQDIPSPAQQKYIVTSTSRSAYKNNNNSNNKHQP